MVLPIANTNCAKDRSVWTILYQTFRKMLIRGQNRTEMMSFDGLTMTIRRSI